VPPDPGPYPTTTPKTLALTALAPSVAASVIGLIAGTLGRIPSQLFTVALTVPIIGCSFFVLARLATHWELRYWRWGSLGQKLMCAMVALEALIAAAFLAAGPWLVIEAGKRHARPIAGHELIITGALFVAILVHSLAMSVLRARLRYPRGSEHAEQCRAARGLRWVAEQLSLMTVFEFFLRKTAPNAVSFIVIAVLSVLLAVASADAILLASHIKSVPTKTATGRSGSSNTTTPTPTTPTTSTQTATSTPQPEGRKHRESPPYSAICGKPGTEAELGHDVPEPQRRILWDQWFLKGQGLGGIYAGCIHAAEFIAATGIWVAAGTCKGQLRGLALAAPDGTGAIVLYRAAKFAKEEALAKALVSETSHEHEHQGDIYTVTTTHGTTVFVRNQIGGGPPGIEEDALQSCTEAGEGTHAVEIPSGLTPLWIEAMKANHEEWLVPTQYGTKYPERFTFTSENPLKILDIHAYCSSATECTLTDSHRTQSTPMPASIDVTRLLGLAGAEPVGETTGQQ
jgi:hypothetical protein